MATNNGTAGEAEAKPEEQQIATGSRVLIKGLQSACQYNGNVGTVESFSPDGRYGIRVQNRESLLMVKSTCLEILDGDAEVSPQVEGDAEAGAAEAGAAEAGAAAHVVSIPPEPTLWESTSDFETKQGDVACEGGQELNESGLRGSLYSSAASDIKAETAGEDSEAGAPPPRASGRGLQQNPSTIGDRWDGVQSSGEDGEVSDVSTTSSPAKAVKAKAKPAAPPTRAPATGSIVSIHNLERSRKYNGEIGKVVEDLGNGFFCVQLRNGKRIKVRQSNMKPADAQPQGARESPAAASPAQPGPSNANAQTPPVTVHVQVQHTPQPNRSASSGDPAAVGSVGRSPPATVETDSAAAQALLRAFQRPELAAEFGRVFVEGAAVRVVDGATQRGIRVSADEGRMRQAAMELTMALETELASERERTERAALAAEGGARGAQVLAKVDEATVGIRALLWVVDVLKYGDPLATPMRCYSVSGSAPRGTLGPAELFAVGWVMSAALGGGGVHGGSPPMLPPHGPQGTQPAPPRFHASVQRSPPPGHSPPMPQGTPVHVHVQGPRPGHPSPQPHPHQHSPDQRRPPPHAHPHMAHGVAASSPSPPPARAAGPSTQRPAGAQVVSAQELAAARALLQQMSPSPHPPRDATETIRQLAPLLQSHMFAAAYKGLPQVIETILAQPARLLSICGVSAGMQQAGTLLQPLHMASFNGHAPCVRLLLGMRGVDVDAVAGDQDRPLHKACFNGHAEVARMLLEAGADPDAVTPLMSERQTQNCPQHGHRQQQVEIRNGLRTPMHYAVFNREKRNLEGRAACVEELLKRGADPNKGDCWGLTALHHASYNNFGLVVEILHREPRTELNRQCGDDSKGDSALMKACFKGHTPLVKTLLSERPSSGIDEMDSPGAEPNVQSRDGITALHYAAEQGHKEVVRLLLESGAELLQDRHGNTPQQLAMRVNPEFEAWFRTAESGGTTHV